MNMEGTKTCPAILMMAHPCSLHCILPPADTVYSKHMSSQSRMKAYCQQSAWPPLQRDILSWKTSSFIRIPPEVSVQEKRKVRWQAVGRGREDEKLHSPETSQLLWEPLALAPTLSLDFRGTAKTGHGFCFHCHLIQSNENCNYQAVIHSHVLQGCCPWHICYPHLENSPIKASDSPALNVEICNVILCARDKNSPQGSNFNKA